MFVWISIALTDLNYTQSALNENQIAYCTAQIYTENNHTMKQLTFKLSLSNFEVLETFDVAGNIIVAPAGNDSPCVSFILAPQSLDMSTDWLIDWFAQALWLQGYFHNSLTTNFQAEVIFAASVLLIVFVFERFESLKRTDLLFERNDGCRVELDWVWCHICLWYCFAWRYFDILCWCLFVS